MINLEARAINLEYGKLAPEQITAIKKEVLLGRELQVLYPEIAEDYRKGMTHKEIVEKYNITGQFGVDEEFAKNTVGYSIRGILRAMFDLKPYSGLITDKEELERLAQDHNIEGGRKTYEQGKGIHGMSEEERIEASRKGGKISAILRGQILWTEIEEQIALELHQEIGKGVCGKNIKIAEIINQEFHKGKKVRTIDSIHARIRELSK